MTPYGYLCLKAAQKLRREAPSEVFTDVVALLKDLRRHALVPGHQWISADDQNAQELRWFCEGCLRKYVTPTKAIYQTLKAHQLEHVLMGDRHTSFMYPSGRFLLGQKLSDPADPLGLQLDQLSVLTGG